MERAADERIHHVAEAEPEAASLTGVYGRTAGARARIGDEPQRARAPGPYVTSSTRPRPCPCRSSLGKCPPRKKGRPHPLRRPRGRCRPITRAARGPSGSLPPKRSTQNRDKSPRSPPSREGSRGASSGEGRAHCSAPPLHGAFVEQQADTMAVATVEREDPAVAGRDAAFEVQPEPGRAAAASTHIRAAPPAASGAFRIRPARRAVRSRLRRERPHRIARCVPRWSPRGEPRARRA